MGKQRHGVTDFLQAFTDVGTTFFDVETDLLIVLDDQGNVERVNKAFERTLNRQEHEMLGRPLVVIVADEDLAKFIKAFYDPGKSQPFRLLRHSSGVVTVRLVAYRFKREPDYQRGYLVLRVM